MTAVSSADGGSRLAQLWRNHDFRWLMGSQLTSSLGDWMATVALMVLVLQLTGSSTAVGGVLVVRLLPALVAGPVASRVVVRWSRRRSMLAMDLLRVGIVVAIPFVAAVWWVYAWAFALELCGLVFLPARDSAIADIVAEPARPMANSLVLGSSYGTIPIGAGAYALAAWVAPDDWALASTTVAFWFDALTFGASFLLLMGLRTPALRSGAPPTPGDRPGFLRALRIPLVRAIAPTTFAVALGLGGLFSLGIVFVREVVGASDSEFGVLIALFGVGAVIGMVLISRVSVPRLWMVRDLVVLQGAVVASMSLSPNVGLAFLGAVLFGATTSATLAVAMSILQSALDERERGLAFTAFHVLIRAGLAIAALGAGVAADLVEGIDWPLVGEQPSARVVLVCSGIVIVLVALFTGRGAAGLAEAPVARAKC